MRCLFIIDLQNGFVTSNTRHIVSKMESLMDSFENDLIIAAKFSNVENSGFTDIMGWHQMKNPPETDLLESVKNHADLIVEKHGYSACCSEVLDILQTYDIKEVYLAGVDTDCCVLETAVDLFEKNIRPIVLMEYCASNGGAESHTAGIKVLERLIGTEQLI